MFPSTILWRANYCRLHSTSPSSRNQPIGRFRPPVYGPGPEGPAPAAPRQTRRRPHRLSLHLATIRARLQVARKRNGPGQSSAAQTRGVTGWRALVEHSAGIDGGGASLGRPSCLRSRSWTRPSRTWTTSYKYARGSRASSARIATPPRPTTRPRSPSTSTASGSMPASSYNFGRAAVSDRHTT
jgi:hypothetical protein